MTTTRRTLSSLAVLALAAGLVTGCGDKDDPSPSAGSEATVTAPVEASDGGGKSAEPTKPDVPKPDPKDYPGMDEHTDEGAEQAYKYFWAAMIWAYQTGDTELFKGLYGDECSSCDLNLHDMKKLNEMNDWWSSTAIKEIDLRVYKSDLNEVEVGYTFVVTSHTEPVSGNSKRKVFADVQYSSVGGLTWISGAWRVNEFNLTEDGE